MSTMRWTRVVGDTNDTLTAQLDGIVDLSGSPTIRSLVWPLAGGAATVLTVTVLSVVDRTVTISLGAWITTAAAGTYNVEIEVTSGGVIRTWPAQRPATLVLRSQGV